MKMGTKPLRWQQYAVWVILTEAVGAFSGWLTREGTAMYNVAAVKPPLSPPGWLFPIVWTTLFLLMGWASYRVYTSGKDPETVRRGLRLYGAQLALNFLWSIVFFRWEQPLGAFFVLLGLWVLILLTIRAFSRVDEQAADLLIPYLLWVTFAGYLNLGFVLRN